MEEEDKVEGSGQGEDGGSPPAEKGRSSVLCRLVAVFFFDKKFMVRLLIAPPSVDTAVAVAAGLRVLGFGKFGLALHGFGV